MTPCLPCRYACWSVGVRVLPADLIHYILLHKSHRPEKKRKWWVIFSSASGIWLTRKERSDSGETLGDRVPKYLRSRSYSLHHSVLCQILHWHILQSSLCLQNRTADRSFCKSWSTASFDLAFPRVHHGDTFYLHPRVPQREDNSNVLPELEIKSSVRYPLFNSCQFLESTSFKVTKTIR